MAAAKEILTTVVSTKGQVILPKPLRDHLRWPAGTRLTVEDTADARHGEAKGEKGGVLFCETTAGTRERRRRRGPQYN
jgi:AbrB family looped-hinge helix DNA binding protein